VDKVEVCMKIDALFKAYQEMILSVFKALTENVFERIANAFREVGSEPLKYISCRIPIIASVHNHSALQSSFKVIQRLIYSSSTSQLV